MAKCFDQSHSAYSHGDGGKAKQLSNDGHQHKTRMEQLNKEASDWIFQANNEDSGPDEVDLHGLYTAEAISRTEQEVAMRQQRGDQSVRVIVGKGIHSKDHVAHIKPAIEDLMRKYNLQAHLDPHNSGVLVVDLTGKAGGAFGRDAGGFTRGLAQQASGSEDQVSRRGAEERCREMADLLASHDVYSASSCRAPSVHSPVRSPIPLLSPRPHPAHHALLIAPGRIISCGQPENLFVYIATRRVRQAPASSLDGVPLHASASATSP